MEKSDLLKELRETEQKLVNLMIKAEKYCHSRENCENCKYKTKNEVCIPSQLGSAIFEIEKIWED